MRKNAKRDGNQDQIVAELRQAGVSVAVTHQLGGGFPDIVTGFRGQNYQFEIKDPGQPPSKRKLTPAEEKYHDEWKGQVDIILSADEALNIMGAL